MSQIKSSEMLIQIIPQYHCQWGAFYSNSKLQRSRILLQRIIFALYTLQHNLPFSTTEYRIEFINAINSITCSFSKFNSFIFVSAINLIEEATYSGIIDPSAEWHTLNHGGPRTRLTYRIRVKCDDFYYNATCTKFCRARDDPFGHYRCNANGDKECIEGWKGTNCEERK